MLMFGLCQAPVRSKHPAVHVVRFLLGQAFSYGIYTSPHTSNSWVGDNDDRFSSGPITTGYLNRFVLLQEQYLRPQRSSAPVIRLKSDFMSVKTQIWHPSAPP